MPLKHNVAATWKDITVWMNVAGTWKKCAVHHNVAGVWKAITQLLGVNLPTTISGSDFAISPTDAVATMTMSSAGTWTCTSGGSGTWMQGGASSEYEARMTMVSGSFSSGSGAGTWLNLGTTRSWTRNESRNGFFTSTATATLEVRMAASPFTVLDTCTVTLTAEVEV
jgi:hypothetical protein